MELTIDEALRKGVEAHRAGQVQEADRYYTAILLAQPKHPDANHNMGVLAVGVGKTKEALPFFKAALESNQNIAQFWLSYLDALIDLDLKKDALAVLIQAKEKGTLSDGIDKLEQRIIKLGVSGPASNVEDESQTRTRVNILDTLNIDHAIKLARKKLRGGLSEEARDIYEAILRRFPKNKKATKGLKAISREPEDQDYSTQDPSQAQLQPLIDYFNRGQFQMALNGATEMLKRFPSSVRLHNICGAVNAGLHRFDMAVENYQNAIAIRPDYAPPYNNLGNVLQAKRDFDSAILSYREAIKLDPKFAGAYNNLGAALEAKGDIDASIDEFNNALKILPDYAEAHCNMGNALRGRGDLETAIESYKQAIKFKADFAEAYNNMGLALKGRGDLEAAIESYKQALMIKNDFADAYYNIANALTDKGDLDAALYNHNQALKIKPDFADAHNNIGIILQKKGDYNAAIVSYKAAIKVKADFSTAYNNMGLAFKGIGDPDAAIESFKQAIKFKTDFAEPYNNMGNALIEEKGELDAAITSYHQALKIKPFYPSCFMNLFSLVLQVSDKEVNDLYIDESLQQNLSRNPKHQIHKSINHFINGNLGLSKEYLRKYHELVKTSETDVLESKDKDFCNGYFNFISSLIEKSLTPKKNHGSSIYHVGESHCLSFSHSVLSLNNQPYSIEPRITFGAKAFHFSGQGVNSFKAITKRNLNKIPRGSKVFVSVGEIDCRVNEGILKAVEKIGGPIEKIVDETVDGYVSWFLSENIVNQHSYFFFNVPAPVWKPDQSGAMNAKHADVVLRFNTALQKKLMSAELAMIDVYSHTKGPEGFSNHLYHCDDTHLDHRMIQHIQDQLTN